MPVQPIDLARHLHEHLAVARFPDFCPNGLQVEGRRPIRRLAVGVTSNLALIETAIEADCDAIIAHHGLFWNNDPRSLTGWRAERLRRLFAQDLSLFAYHLPLDAHAELGNNAGMLRSMAIEPTRPFVVDGMPLGWSAQIEAGLAREDFIDRVIAVTGREPLVLGESPEIVHHLTVLSGGGAKYFEQAVAEGADLYVTGEPAESSQALAEELGRSFVAAGHHATERFGPQLLGKHIAERYGIELVVVDIDNPV
jgi:dinuclear metal center YbgI/SA1388 family protein